MFLEKRDGSSSSGERPTIVVADALAAQQWEAHLAAPRVDSGTPAWVTAPIVSYASWLEDLWSESDGVPPIPLTPAQSRALWRRVIAESAEADELIGHGGVADWAAAAWGLLHRWRIDPRAERARAEQLDYRALLGWCNLYREFLDAHGWIDRAELEGRLATAKTRARGAVVMADLTEAYPARTSLFAHLTAAGQSVEQGAVPSVAARQRAVRLADAADELKTALHWAATRLEHTPRARVAVVVAGLRERSTEVQRALAASFPTDAPSPVWQGGQPLGADAALGAALTALTLSTPNASYATFGRWLRSPFFATSPAECAARAQLDADLRADLRSQLAFATAYRQCGLAEMLQHRTPQTASALAAGLTDLAPHRTATPGQWAHRWSRFLERLGWQAPADVSTLRGWQGSLDELARLTPIVGEITSAAALRELERITTQPTPRPLPLRGIHVLGHVDEVGPGYDGVWATGFTDSFWPEAVRGNPLLPHALQRLHGMPRSSPQDARDRSARSLARLVSRVPELVVSWPARVYDYETEPSPAIRNWSQLAADEVTAPLREGRPRLIRARETVVDPPPAALTPALPGGAGMLGRQARCPLRAFCQDRLGARALEPLGLGLTKRLRGIAVHRAAELLLGARPSQAELITTPPAALAQSAERALARVFGRSRVALQALFALEEEQLRETLGALIAAEGERQPFRVLAVEQRSEVPLGPWTLDIRIDRLDRLADGAVACIDYKTGDRGGSAAWLAPRLRDAQVPLYAIQSADAVGAAVVARVGPATVSYSGLWRNASFPGRPNHRWDGDWPGLLGRWRTELERLAAEFAAGDTRLLLDTLDDAEGTYAPLTRVCEQVGLARGTVPAW